VAESEVISSAGDPALQRIALVLRRTVLGVIAVALTAGIIAWAASDGESGFVSEGVIELTDDVSRGITSPGSRTTDARIEIEAQKRWLESSRVLVQLQARLGRLGPEITGIVTSQPEESPVIIVGVEATSAATAELAVSALIEMYAAERLDEAVASFGLELETLRVQQGEQSGLVDSIVQVLNDTRESISEAEVGVLENRTAAALNRLTEIDVAIQEREFFQRTVDGEVRVIEESSPARKTSTSSVVRGVQFGLVALFLGFGAVLIASRVRGRLHLLDEVRSVIGPNVPVIATIPRFRRRYRKGASALVVAYAGSQREAEAFRYMRSAIEVAAAGKTPVSVLFTSAAANEGKTVASSNLALASARAGNNTFLLDGDLLNSSVSNLFAQTRVRNGFRALLDQKVEATENIWYETGRGATSLTVLITNTKHEPTDRSELSIEAVSRVLTSLNKLRDIVVIDGPPVLAVSDAMILARSADITFVVVRMGKTTRRDLEGALTQLKQGGVEVGGVIISHSREKRESYYGYGYGSKK